MGEHAASNLVAAHANVGANHAHVGANANASPHVHMAATTAAPGLTPEQLAAIARNRQAAQQRRKAAVSAKRWKQQ